jgi:uncharacterized protein YodC (DUF2158 family)
MDFKPGDVVRLKSGGPRMTVEQVGKTQFGDDGVWCVWFETSGSRQVAKRETFPPVALEDAAAAAIGSMRVTRA